MKQHAVRGRGVCRANRAMPAADEPAARAMFHLDGGSILFLLLLPPPPLLLLMMSLLPILALPP